MVAGVDESLHFEDFEVGSVWSTGERTVTVADIEAFADVSGDRNPLHLDDEAAAESVFGGRIAHGVLGLAVATGLINRRRLTAGTLVAFLGVDWRFRRPLFPETRVTVALTVVSKRRTSRPDRGVVVLRAELRDGKGEPVQDGELTYLIACRGAAERRRPGEPTEGRPADPS